MEVKIISAKDTYFVRLELLRNNSPISHEFSGDNDSDTFHLGVFSEGNIVSVSSYMKSSNNKFSGTQYQLRGMATTTSFQGKGCGKIMIKKAEAILKEKSIDIIWCNAREVALEFYQKQGFILVGSLFDIKYAGLHSVMFKNV
jgi:predicted GNAT family N-acyltransferase